MQNSLITISRGTYFFIAIFFIGCFSSPPPIEDNINLTEVIDSNSLDTLQNIRLDQFEENLISTKLYLDNISKKKNLLLYARKHKNFEKILLKLNFSAIISIELICSFFLLVGSFTSDLKSILFLSNSSKLFDWFSIFSRSEFSLANSYRANAYLVVVVSEKIFFELKLLPFS